MTSPFTGLIAAPFTPFGQHGGLNLDVLDAYARHLKANGVSGVFVAGTTGEAPSLAHVERTLLAERWIEVARPLGLKVIVQVGHNCLQDACALARHAQSIGADAISAHAPTFFRPTTPEQLVDFCVPIARAAEPLPFFFYHLPGYTGVHLPMAEFLAAGRERLPTLRGLKFSHIDLIQLQECLHLDGGFDVLFGIDELLLGALALGVRGAVGATYNFAAPLYHRVIGAFESGDLALARREQARSVELVRFLQGFGFLPAAKALMGLLGIDCGPVRLPLRPLGAEETALLRQRVTALLPDRL
jgi:N-acetylneuraminate lyase